MAKYQIGYAHRRIKTDGTLDGSAGVTQTTVQAETEQGAMEIIKGKHPGKRIEFRKIVKK